MPDWRTLHKDFRLNGLSYSPEGLKDLAYGFLKEGEKHEQAIGNFLQDWLGENESIKVFTSGSTGKPKETSLKKSHMVNSAVATREYFDLEFNQNALLCLSADYIAGKMMLVRAMVLGLEIDFVVPSSNPLESISQHYDFCAMVPLQLENSIEKIEHIKKLIVGGGAISNSLKEKVQNTNCEIFETYGMTETITHVAVKKINNLESSDHPEHFGDAQHRLVEGPAYSAFKALPNVLFSKDERQCLIINSSKISDEPVVTNDVVDLISETEFEWLGRFDNVINSGGVKLFPEQIEAKLDSIISNRFFVAGLPDEKLGQKLVLIVEGPIDKSILTAKITELPSLDQYEKPKKIYSLPTFLETETNKIHRKENINLILS